MQDRGVESAKHGLAPVLCSLTNMDAQFQEDEKRSASGVWIESGIVSQCRKVWYLIPKSGSVGEGNGWIFPAGSTMHFEQVLQFARFAVLQKGVRNSQLAIGESGLIFFAPMETRVGGFVCWEKSSQVNVIGQLQNNSFKPGGEWK